MKKREGFERSVMRGSKHFEVIETGKEWKERCWKGEREE